MITSKNYDRYIHKSQNQLAYSELKKGKYPSGINADVNMRFSDQHPITPLMIAIWNKQYTLCVEILSNPDLDLNIYTTECNPIYSLFELGSPNWQYRSFDQLVAVLISKNHRLAEFTKNILRTKANEELFLFISNIETYDKVSDISKKIYLAFSISRAGLITEYTRKIDLDESKKWFALSKQHLMQVSGTVDSLSILLNQEKNILVDSVAKILAIILFEERNSALSLHSQQLFNCYIALGNYQLKAGINSIHYFSIAKRIGDLYSSVLGNENRQFLNACDSYMLMMTKNSKLYEMSSTSKYSDWECIFSFISAARSGSEQAKQLFAPLYSNIKPSCELYDMRYLSYSMEIPLPVKLLISDFLRLNHQSNFSNVTLTDKKRITIKLFIEALELYYSHPGDVETLKSNISKFNNLISTEVNEINLYACIYSAMSQYQHLLKVIAIESSEQKPDHYISPASAVVLKQIILDICSTFDALLKKYKPYTKKIIYLQPLFILQDILLSISPFELTELEIILREKIIDVALPFRQSIDSNMVSSICDNIKKLERISTLSGGPRYFIFYKELAETTTVFHKCRAAILQAILLGDEASVAGVFHWSNDQQSFQEICDCLNAVIIKNHYDYDAKMVANIHSSAGTHSPRFTLNYTETNLTASLTIVNSIRDDANLINLIDKKLLDNDVNPALIRLSLHYLNQNKIRRGCYFNCLLMLEIELHQHKYTKEHHYSDKSKDFIFQRAKDFISGLAQHAGEHQKLAQWYLEAYAQITQLINSGTLILSENITALLVGYGLKSPFKNEFMYAMITYPEYERFIEKNLKNFKLLTVHEPTEVISSMAKVSEVELVPFSDSPYSFINRNIASDSKASVSELSELKVNNRR